MRRKSKEAVLVNWRFTLTTIQKQQQKKLSEEGKWFVVPENGKSKEKAQKKKPKPEQIKRLVLTEIMNYLKS